MILLSLLAVSAGQLFAAELAFDQQRFQGETLEILINAIASKDDNDKVESLVADMELELLNAHDGVFSPLGAALSVNNKVAEELLRDKGATVVVDNYKEFIENKSLPQKPTFMSQEEWDRSASE